MDCDDREAKFQIAAKIVVHILKFLLHTGWQRGLVVPVGSQRLAVTPDLVDVGKVALQNIGMLDDRFETVKTNAGSLKIIRSQRNFVLWLGRLPDLAAAILSCFRLIPVTLAPDQVSVHDTNMFDEQVSSLEEGLELFIYLPVYDPQRTDDFKARNGLPGCFTVTTLFGCRAYSWRPIVRHASPSLLR